jgi:hypothetical protein
MRDIEIESWVLRVADEVSRGARVEDSRVELKSRWPDEPNAAARRIAAHANAARGASVLWIIGIDEVKGVCGADPNELAKWFGRVRSEFDDVYPELHDLNVRVGEETVVALLFSTTRAPFLVRNPVFGAPGGGPVQLEIPWREGRSTRTATRQDLIRLLTPLIQLPELEILTCTLSVREPNKQSGIVKRTWQITGDLYVIPLDSKPIVFPFHRSSLKATLPDGSTIDFSPVFRLSAPTALGVDRARGGGPISYRDSMTVDASNSEALVSGPGRLRLHGSVEHPSDPAVGAAVTVELRLNVVGGAMPLVAIQRLQPSGSGNRAEWSLPNSSSWRFTD